MTANVESMAYVRKDKTSDRELPWHKSIWPDLSNEADEAMTSGEALVRAGIDWRVRLIPSVGYAEGGYDLDTGIYHLPQYIADDDAFKVMRVTDRNILGNVGKYYTPIQNEEWLEFGDALVGTGKAKWDTAGSLKGGRLVFASFKLEDVADAASFTSVQDPHDLYVLLSNAHDGSGAARGDIVPVRTVCTNTHNMALQHSSATFKIKHTKNWSGKLEEARRALDLTVNFTEEYSNLAERMANTQLELEAWDELVADLIPIPETRGRDKAESERVALNSVRKFSPNIAEDLRGTNWGALNAVSEFFQHIRDERSDKRTAATDRKLLSTVFGGTAQKGVQKAFKSLTAGLR